MIDGIQFEYDGIEMVRSFYSMPKNLNVTSVSMLERWNKWDYDLDR